jgi:MFS family permease
MDQVSRTSKKGSLMKFSLLSVSLVLTSSTAISAAIPKMAETFQGYSLSAIELLTTIPSFMVMIFVFLSSFIAKALGQKKTVVLGLILTGVCGIIPFFFSNYVIVLLSRAGLGIGFGLMNSLAVSMISLFFSGQERATLIGFQSAFQGLGAAGMTFIAGQLLNNGWQSAFLVYALSFLILPLFILFVPGMKKEDGSNHAEEVVFRTNRRVIGYSIFLMVIAVLYNAVFVKLATVVTSSGIGNDSATSTIFSILQIASMGAGFLFGFVQSKIGKFIFPVSITCMAAGFFLISSLQGISIVAIGAILVGVAFSLMIPYLFTQVSIISPENAGAFNTSILLVGANIGSFLAPYGLYLIASIPTTKSMVAVFVNSGIILILLGVMSVIMIRQKD